MPHGKFHPDEGSVQKVIVLKEDPDGMFSPRDIVDAPTGTVQHVIVDNAEEFPGGTGGGSGVDPVSIKDGTDATRKLAVDASGRIGINNLPATQTVSGTVSVANFPATQPVSGTVTVSNPTANPETGLAKDATLAATRDRLPAELDADGGLKVHVQNSSGGSSGGLTNTELRASPVPVSGTVSVGNFPATQPVSGSVAVSNFPATQPVSGTVSVGNFPATQPVSGTVAVGNSSLAVTGPLTDVQLRAAAVPVSGPLTDAQLRAAAVPVTGTFWQSIQPVSGTVGVSGNVDVTPASPAANDYLPVRLTDGTAFYSATGGSGGGSSQSTLTTFSVETPYVATAAAAATKVIFAMLNPVGSAKVIKIRTIWVSAGNAAPPAALGILEWVARRITAIVGGTAVTAIKMDTADAATVATPLVHSPTSVTASLTTSAWTSRWITAIGTANVLGYLPGQFIRFGDFGHKPLTLRAGEGLAIEEFTRVVHAPNVVVGVEWTEE